MHEAEGRSIARHNILLVANFADRVGGGEESLLTLARWLDRRRFGVHAIVPGEGELAEALRREGIPVAAVRFPSLRPWNAAACLRTVSRLRSLMADWKIRLVHAHGSRCALYANLAARGLRVPVIWHVRVVDRDRLLDPILLKLSAAVIANSQATAGRLGGRRGALEKTHVIYNGVDLDRFSQGTATTAIRRALGLEGGQAVCAFIGRLEQGKGPDILLDAAPLIRKEVPRAAFVFIGRGPLREALEARARQQDVRATFVGQQEDIAAWLRACAVVVVPSRQEGFSRVVVEAMAAGVPVVAARVGGIPEVCRHAVTGLLVPPEDPVALASAVVATLRDEGATKQRVAGAVEEVRARFSADGHAARVGELYDDLLRITAAHDG